LGGRHFGEVQPEWEQLAAKHGYFDQSHLIRDFLEFYGFSPADYLRRLKNLRAPTRG